MLIHLQIWVDSLCVRVQRKMLLRLSAVFRSGIFKHNVYICILFCFNIFLSIVLEKAKTKVRQKGVLILWLLRLVPRSSQQVVSCTWFQILLFLDRCKCCFKFCFFFFLYICIYLLLLVDDAVLKLMIHRELNGYRGVPANRQLVVVLLPLPLLLMLLLLRRC